MAEITKIEKLNGKNYQSWKYNMKLVLMQRGLWGFTQEGQETAREETATAAVRNAFRLQSDKAYSLIALNVEKHLQVHISSTTNPLKTWKNLQKQFEFVSINQIVRLNRKFYAANMENGADLMKHITYMTSLVKQLREMKEDISPKKFATVVLGSLPESYDNVLTSLNARDAEKLDWDDIKGLLIEENMKQKEKSDKNKFDNGNALFTKGGRKRFDRGRRQEQARRTEWSNDYKPLCRRSPRGSSTVQRCFRCNQLGHIVKNCPNNNNQNNNRGEHSKMAEYGRVALISNANNTKKWFIDSPATKQMTHDKSILMYYNEYQQPAEIYLGDNTVVLALGEGMVRLHTGDETDFNLELHKVLFVPNLAKNLLSVPAIALMRAKVYFDKEKCIVMKDGKEFVIGQLSSNRLYTVDTTEFAQTVTETDKPTPEVWHQRLGHLNNNYVHQLTKKEMVVGMNYDVNCPVEKECKGCTLGKMQRGPFPKHSQHRATKPYEMIHSDICRPMQVASKGGSRYMLTFTDDFSRYTTVYFLKNKSEVLSKFKEHVNLVENQNGKVKVLRSDNGGEYTSHNFANYCAEKGILHEFTSPYCPE